MSHNDVNDEAAALGTSTATRLYQKGPTVYVGDTHYTTCDTDGWHRDWIRSTGGLIGRSCRCSDWIGGCVARAKGEKLQ